MSKNSRQEPSIVASIIPIIVLVGLLYVAITLFGTHSIAGASQIALILSAAVAVFISMIFYGSEWSKIETAIVENITASAAAIIILLLIGMLSGTWMVSGVVPTMILYGLEILNPKVFLASASVICAVVSVMTGSSWTTIATIGVALMGIGTAQGFSAGWTAGAIISGSYFGDKLSVLSDTTIMASSTIGVKIFDHIRYMLITTIPTFTLALIIFIIAGFTVNVDSTISTDLYSSILSDKFNISPWLLLIPAITMFMIVKRLPAMITLTFSSLIAIIAMVLTQPQIVAEIAEIPINELNNWEIIRAAMMSCYGSTSITTESEAVNALISTRGMEGMLVTIWLILCAMCFGGVMTGSGMLQRITALLHSRVKRTSSVVASTLVGGVFFNMCTADQFISIILSGRLFKKLYDDRGLEPRLLSRTIEDSASVTSVLIPWTSCGMAQASVLGVSTWIYFPYCFFNLLSPIVSYIIAVLGYKIVKTTKQNL
ncbi:MAG: Na+/H+ antiporter NhaC family protein [Rikenellaceae bacterium]